MFFGFFSVGSLFIGKCFNMGDVHAQKPKSKERIAQGLKNLGIKIRSQKEDGEHAQTGKVRGYEMLELTSHKNY